MRHDSPSVWIGNILIPLRDGISLAADLSSPTAPGRFPALVSYYPYHKDDLIGALFDHPNRYFAARGYASLLVDFRGLGNSEGVAWDTGDPREDDDGAQIVEWAAGQDWCDGAVGMWGMSYGGITSFKTAAQRPRHLKAIVPMNGTLDFYHGIDYPGGCFNCLGMLGGWGPFMTAMNWPHRCTTIRRVAGTASGASGSTTPGRPSSCRTSNIPPSTSTGRRSGPMPRGSMSRPSL